MFAVRATLILAFLCGCCVLGAKSLRCYTCTGVKNCADAYAYDCSAALANASYSYLAVFYADVDTTQISDTFNCLSDSLFLNTSQFDSQFKGCVYSNADVCNLTVAANSNYTRSCNQCATDYCNPAARAALTGWTLLGVVALAAALKLAVH